MSHNECICEGNFRDIIHETQPLFDKIYVHKGEDYIFAGVLWGPDDLYYTMWNVKTNVSTLLSCVGSLDSWDFKIKEDWTKKL